MSSVWLLLPRTCLISVITGRSQQITAPKNICRLNKYVGSNYREANCEIFFVLFGFFFSSLMHNLLHISVSLFSLARGCERNTSPISVSLKMWQRSREVEKTKAQIGGENKPAFSSPPVRLGLNKRSLLTWTAESQCQQSAKLSGAAIVWCDLK